MSSVGYLTGWLLADVNRENILIYCCCV